MNTRKGFTLVELLVVIAILAILATVSVVGYTSFINSANDSVALTELTQIRDYAMNYDLAGENGNKDGQVNKTEAEAAIAAVNSSATVEWSTGDVAVKYTVSGGSAYWVLATGKVTAEAPAGWATSTGTTTTTTTTP